MEKMKLILAAILMTLTGILDLCAEEGTGRKR